MIAHADAYNRTRILHRDVSEGNILITEEGAGILIDWDLSKKVIGDADGQPRRHSRTVSGRSYISRGFRVLTELLPREHGNSCL